MTMTTRIAMLAAAAAFLPASQAMADYDIMGDAAFPSVVYIEFDPSTLPQIIIAPENGSGGPVVLGSQGSAVGGSGSVSDSGSSSSSRQSASAPQSFQERANQRVNEIVQGGQKEVENTIIEREIEDTILDGVLR